MELKKLQKHIRILANLPETDEMVVSCYLALEPMRMYLADSLLPDAKGIAIFSRAGEKPFFLPLQFQVVLPYWIAVDLTPNIYHLVKLKDTYHRYVVLITTRESARIIEINVGSVTRELWTQRPELRKRIGQEWAKMHL